MPIRGSFDDDTLPDPKAIPNEARARVGELIAVGYRRSEHGIEDPDDERVSWTIDQVARMGAEAFRAVLARRRKR